MKTPPKKHLISFVVLTLLTSGVLWFGGDRFNNATDDIIIPTEFIFQGKTIALAWTDDNTGEDLIIQSDRKEYSGFNEIDVYFSITNASGADQNMDVVIWVGNEKVEVKEVLKINNEEKSVGSIVSLELWNLSAEQSQTGSTASSRYRSTLDNGANDETSDEVNSQTGSTLTHPNPSQEGNQDNGANDIRKDIKGFETGYVVNDQIKSGETNFYKAKIKYPPMSNGEFFIEAFGVGVGSIVPLGLWSQNVNLQTGSTALRDNGANEGSQTGSTLTHPNPSQEGNQDYGANDIAYGHLDPWYSSSWNYKRQITIDHSEVADVADPSTTYANFPVYVHATGLSNIKADGADIRFTSSDGETELPREIEKYASGTLDAWVKVTLTKDAGDSDDDVIYMYYGNDSATEPASDSAYGRENVWDDNFVMVQHLQEIPDNTEDQIKDSTSNANDGQTVTMASDDQVAGQIDGSFDFDGGDDYVDAGNGASVQLVSGTVETWIKTSSAGSSYRGIVTKQHAYGAFLVDNVFGIYDWGASSFRTSGINLADGNWHHAVFSFQSGVADGTKFYIDGVWRLDTTITISNQTIGIAIAAGTTGVSQNFNGLIDEVRISNTARTAGWIETEYNNQSDVGSFITIGEEMSTDWYNTNWKYRRQIDINSSQIAITTSDFPILVTTTLDDLKTIANGGNIENDNGYDIIFVNPLGNTLLNFEREKYTGTTGEIIYWIKTDISSTTDKKIYIYYGNASATDQSTTTGVWDDNYKGVWHLAETDIDNDAGDIKDSAVSANNGTTYNMNTDDQAAGQINGSLDFNGTDNYISIGDAYNGVKTISFWLKSDDITDRMILDIDGADYIQINASSEIEPISFPATTIYIDGAVASLIDTSWHYAVITDTTGVNASAMDIGKVVSSYFDGQIDEVRISNTVRHAGWIETEYNNQSDANSFLTINAEESLKLVITTSAKILTAGTESTAFTVQIQNTDDTARSIGHDIIISLSSDSSLYSFASTTGGTAVSSVIIPSGSNSVNFYYIDHKIGSPTITVSATNLVSDTQQQTVQYQYRRKITLEADQIATTTDNFPVLATTTLDDLKTTANGGKVGNDNGYDIFFTDDDGATVLDFEREKYASTTGEIVYWIKTDISSTTNKTIYMYYGNADAVDQSNATGVWDDNFVMVQHLQETPDNTEDQIKDSTSYANDGQTFTMTSEDQVTGQIDGSLDFNGSDDYVDIGTQINMASWSAFSIGAWVKYDSSGTDEHTIISSWSVSNNIAQMMLRLEPSNDTVGAFFIAEADTAVGGNFTDLILTPNQLHLVKMTFNTTNGLQAYLDGVKSSTSYASAAGFDANASPKLWIGESPHNSPDGFTGTIDEVRISNIARTSGWIETEYNNQSDIGSFMTIGAEETLKLDITTAAKVIVAGTESTAITVQADHNVAADTTINLSSDSTGTYHFAATPGGAGVSSVTIPSGTSSVDFYYTDCEAGSPTIVVYATNFASDDQQQTVVKIITQLNSPHSDKWTDGLVGYWSFDGQDMDWSQSTTEARDTSGQANHGDVIGATSAIGKAGQGMSFDGGNDYVDVGNVYNGVKTVSFWVKADNVASKKIIDINGTDQIETDAGGNILATSFPAATIYVDGAVASAITTDWHFIVITDTTGVNVSAMDIGRVLTEYFSGTIDEVRIYDRALSADEIAKQYRVGARKFQIDPSKGYKTIIE